jgi:hypothetical protein
MDTIPAATPVTRPFDPTLAMKLLLLDQAMLRPVSMLPAASRNTARAWAVAPTWSEEFAMLTVTVATAGGCCVETVSVADPVCPSEVARMLALPLATAVTVPLALTVATDVFELDQLIVRPVSTLLLASRRVAVACVVCPTLRVEFASATLTVATGDGAGGGADPLIVTKAESSPQEITVLWARTTYDPGTVPAVYRPFWVTVPPVALHVAVVGTGVEAPDNQPSARNWWVWPGLKVIASGATVMAAIMPEGLTVIALESLKPHEHAAMIRKLPAVCPAVNNPCAVIVPPVADQLTLAGPVVPLLYWA